MTAMQRLLISAVLWCCTASASAQTLNLPERAANARGGNEFARSLVELPQKEREEKIVAEIKAGNVPAFLRKLIPVAAANETDKVTYHVLPDYLAVGSDEDYFLVPLTPHTAQAIADSLDCALPTPKIVDDIYAAATIKLIPEPIPPTPAMTTVPVFIQHNELVLKQRKQQPRGGLVAGHKKDVVIAKQILTAPGKVAIYGWHKPDDKPIQPLYAGHADSWADYSHGIRLVQRKVTVNDQPRTIDEVLADPKLCVLLSNEGSLPQTRYPSQKVADATSPKAAAGEKVTVLRLDRGVRVVINEPEELGTKDVLLVYYALPNGNTIEQTIGKALQPGDDWHFDIQHIGAQTRFVRKALADRAVVVAYLENDLHSWPTWRRQQGDAAILLILDAVRSRYLKASVRVVHAGHSGGGSLLFGYLNTIEKIPDDVERIAFLDSNYAYETGKHRDKLVAWLKSPGHRLIVLAYNDAVALLNGKPFVSESGGTWGRSRQMLTDLSESFKFSQNSTDDMQRHTALEGRVLFLLKENPDRKIFHTVQVERNGFIECLLSGTTQEGVGYQYFGDRAYSSLIAAE